MPINIPKIITRAWASLGSRFDIPENADASTGKAGYAQGFSEINRTPLEAGGIPPWGQDMNGVLYDLSSAIQYQQSGVLMPFNSAFATAIGGYAVGAIVSDASDNSILWINGTANNLAHPTGWTNTSLKQATEAIQGTTKIATQAEVNAGTSEISTVTPAKLRFGFTFITVTSAWGIKFPAWLGGFIIQGGNSSGFATYTIVFPIAYPTKILGIPLATGIGAPGSAVAATWVETGNATNSQFMAACYRPGPSGGSVESSRTISWISVGH